MDDMGFSGMGDASPLFLGVQQLEPKCHSIMGKGSVDCQFARPLRFNLKLDASVTCSV